MKQLVDPDRLDWLVNRARKEARRKHRKEVNAKRRRQDLAEERNRFGTKSKIVNLLAKPTNPQKRKSITAHIPTRFSLMDNPKESLRTIRDFATLAVGSSNLRQLIIDHHRVVSTDLGANAILDLVASELEAERRIRGRRRLKVGGYYPKDERLVRFIKAIGIIRHLDVKHEAPTPDESKTLQIFDRRNKHYAVLASAGSATYRDHSTVAFVKHIDECLLASGGSELKKAQKMKLTNYVTEILNNAEEHSDFVDWSILGYLDMSDNEPTCELVLFNFGTSIAESFQALPRSSYPWEQIQPYLAAHVGASLFSPSWTEDDLLTVVALQPHVSRANESEDDTRGQGTVELINFFQKVRDDFSTSPHPAEMVIISGRTFIKFDGTYRLSARKPGASKVIAFNATNSLSEKPDARFVQNLDDCPFPGTAICIKFPLGLPIE